jgi:hypothetical protein
VETREGLLRLQFASKRRGGVVIGGRSILIAIWFGWEDLCGAMIIRNATQMRAEVVCTERQVEKLLRH